MKQSILRKLILIAVLLNGSLTLHVSCTESVLEPEYYFVMWLEGGGIVAYPFAEHPNVTYSDGQLKITTDVKEVYIEPDKVKKFTINNSIPEISIIQQVDASSGKVYNGKNYISFVGCRAGMDVYVYAMNGMLVKTAKTDSSGMLYLSLEELDSGVYIIKSEEITCKIMKR